MSRAWSPSICSMKHSSSKAKIGIKLNWDSYSLVWTPKVKKPSLSQSIRSWRQVNMWESCRKTSPQLAGWTKDPCSPSTWSPTPSTKRRSTWPAWPRKWTNWTSSWTSLSPSKWSPRTHPPSSKRCTRIKWAASPNCTRKTRICNLNCSSTRSSFRDVFQLRRARSWLLVMTNWLGRLPRYALSATIIKIWFQYFRGRSKHIHLSRMPTSNNSKS